MEKEDLSLDAKMLLWAKTALSLAQIKEREATLRRAICQDLFEDREGEITVKKQIGDILFTAKSVVNRKVDNTVLTLMWEELSKDEKECIRWKPEIALTNYRKIEDDSTLHEAVTESPGMPQLKAKEKVS